jgi:ADP-heptose:LPS heptosyltransferase
VNTRIGTSRRFHSFFYSDRLSIHRRSSGSHQTDLELRHLDLFNYKDRAIQPNISATEIGLARAEELLGLNHKPNIVIHPGSSGSAPNWPVEHYRELAVMIREKLKFKVAVTDSKPGLQGFDGCIDLGGKTDLESLAGVLARAEVFVSGSTGPLHLADALGIPCVSFFVARSDIGPERWGPRRNLENVLLPPEHCDCTDLRKCRCLGNIPPLKAFEKIVEIIKTVKTAGVKED